MVTYAQAVDKFGEIPHVYAGVTATELKLITIDKFVTQVDGITLVGAYEPIPALERKELVAPLEADTP